MTLDPGARLGTYEILGPLGSGGMGEVYRARDRKLGREVALKILSEAFASDPARVTRFEREARMLAAVNHPSIAAIYGAEEDGDFRYIVMELVPGETLAQMLATGPLPVPQALGLAAQIADALSVAHEKGVIHRDLKPANIKVTPDGRVKVLDLGLAKAMEVPAESALSDSPTVVMDDSRPGNILGTPGFMSPEQARGKETDRRTDIWAFGCVLFEMLSGKRAFPGDSVPDILLAILDREPDWKALPAAVPPRVADLLRRCLQKDQNHRLRDAGDIRIEIERALEEAARPRIPVLSALRRGWKPAAAIVGGLAVVAATWSAMRSSPAASLNLPERKQLAVLPFRNLTGDQSTNLMGVGMVETVSVRLSGLPGLQVVTPTTSVAVAEKESEVLQAARDLGANLLVLGTLQRQGDIYRITYRVLNVRDGVQIAANSVDGSASDLFALQDALADRVAKDLRFPGAVRRPTVAPGLDASQQERYLQAIGLLQRYDKRDSVERALQLLRGLSEERPNSAVVQAALSRASLGMFDFTKEPSWADRATAAIDTARALDPQLPEVDVTFGHTLLATGRAKEAVEAFRRALTANPGDYETLLGLGRACWQTGDDAAAEDAFRRAVDLQPATFAAYNQLGAFYAGRGRYADAASAFARAARVTPDSYRVLGNLGGVEAMRCNFSGALVAFRRALALQPNDPSAWSNLGLTQLWAGRYDEAVEALEKATIQGANDYRVWGNLGDAYRAARGQREKAAEAYERSIKLAREKLRLNPRSAEAHSFIATGLAKTGHTAEASEHAGAAISLDSKNPDILSDAAVVAALAGRDAEALEWLRKAVAAGYCRAIIARQPEFARLKDEPAFRSIVAAPRAAAGS